MCSLAKVLSRSILTADLFCRAFPLSSFPIIFEQHETWIWSPYPFPLLGRLNHFVNELFICWLPSFLYVEVFYIHCILLPKKNFYQLHSSSFWLYSQQTMVLYPLLNPQLLAWCNCATTCNKITSGHTCTIHYLFEDSMHTNKK